MNEAILALCCLRFPALIRGEWTVAVLCATKGFSERFFRKVFEFSDFPIHVWRESFGC